MKTRAHGRKHHARPHHARTLALPAGFQALALLTFAHRLHTRKRRAERRQAAADRFRRSLRRSFALRRL